MENMGIDRFWRDKRVLVTGATGLVGSWLVKKLLEQGAYVVSLIRDADPQSELIRTGCANKTSIVNGALEDFKTIERAINEHDVDTVFHLGAQPLVGVAHRYPLQTFEANIRGTYNLLEACRIHIDLVKRIVIASSDKAYGPQENLPYIEDMPLTGRHPYEVSKSCSDLVSQSYFYSYSLPIAIARCGNIYGGGDLNWSRIVPATIKACLKKEKLVVRSDGKFVRDYLYVQDVVQAYILLASNLALSSVQGEAFNFSPEKPFTVLEIIEKIKHLMRCEQLEIEILNRAAGEIFSQYLSSRKALDVLNWQPQYSLELGLTETIQWYSDYFQTIKD